MTDAPPDLRPWSPVEIAVRIRRLMEEKDEALGALEWMGNEASRLNWRFEAYRAKAVQQGQGSNQDLRRANAMLTEFEVDETVEEQDGQVAKRKVSKSVARMGFDADVAANRFKNQHRVIASLESDLSTCQTLLNDARRV